MNFKEFMEKGIYNAEELKEVCSNSEHSRYFFSKDNQKFFNTRLSGLMWVDCYSCYFITSESSNDGINYWTKNQEGERRFTVRVCDMRTGKIDTLSKFYEFETLHQARKFIYEFLEGTDAIKERMIQEENEK